MAETALIGVDIDLTLINRRLAEAGELTAKEARHMQRELTQAFQRSARASEDAARQMARAQSKAARDAEREARRAAREVERSFGEQASAVRGLFSAALGGVGGDLMDLADATDGVSDSMAFLGVTLGTLAIAPVIIGEIAEALRDTAQAGIEARDSLAEAGIMVDQLFTPAQLAALEAYEENLFMNQQAAEKLSTELGAKVAPAASKLDDAFLGLRSAGGVLVDVFGGAAGGIAKVSEAALMSPISLNPLKFLILEAGQRAGETKAEMDALAKAEQELAIEARNAARALKEQEEFLENSADYLEVLGMHFPTLERGTSKTTKSTRDHSDALKEAEEATSRYQTAVEYGIISVSDATMGFTNLDLSMQGVVENAGLTAEAIETVNEQAAESARIIGSEEEPGPFARMTPELLAAGEAALATAEALTPLMGNLQQLAAIEQRQHEERVRQLRDQRALSRQVYQDAANAYEQSRHDMTASERAAQEDYLARLAQSEAAKRKQMREFEQEERAAAMKAYRRQKALQLVQIAIDSARNAVALTAAFAYAGPWAPVIATGIATAQGTTAALLVDSQPPPQFHFGTTAVSASLSGNGGAVGIPGAEVPAVLEQGEGVINRRGMATPGMAELVEAVNAGRAPTGRSMVTDIEADLLAQRLNRPYAPAIRGRALAGTNTFYRGR